MFTHLKWWLPCNFFGYFERIYGREIYSKIAKFLAKEPSHEHCSRAVKWGQQGSRFTEKGDNTGVWLWRWSQSPIIPMEDRKKHAKFAKMWWFCSVFSSIKMAWYTVSSYQTVIRSIKNYPVHRLREATRRTRLDFCENNSYLAHMWIFHFYRLIHWTWSLATYSYSQNWQNPRRNRDFPRLRDKNRIAEKAQVVF